MNLESFANSTIEVTREDGIDAYLPTIVLPQINEFCVFEGIPENVDHKEAIQNVVRRSGYESQEFLFGVLSSPGVITVGHFRPDQATQFMKITEVGDDYEAEMLDACEWWKVTKMKVNKGLETTRYRESSKLSPMRHSGEREET